MSERAKTSWFRRFALRCNPARLGVIIGLGGVGVLVARRWVQSPEGDTMRAHMTPWMAAHIDQLLGWGAFGLGCLALVASATAAYAKLRRKSFPYMGTVGVLLGLGLLVLRYVTLAPSFSAEDLRTFAASAKPHIEAVTQRTFRQPVPIRLGSTEEHGRFGRKLADLSEECGYEDSELPRQFSWLGVYDQDANSITMFPDGLAWAQRTFRLWRWEAEALYRQMLVSELVHALDDQYWPFPSKEELLAMTDEQPHRFMVLRAVMEGHAEWVAREVMNRLGHHRTDARTLSVAAGGRERYQKADEMTKAVSWAIDFVYKKGFHFVKEIRAAEGQTLADELLEHPPPWMHYIGYPSLYLADRASGNLRFYEGLGEMLDTALPAERWTLRASSLSVDVPVPPFRFDLLNETDRALRKHMVASWFVSFQHAEREDWWIVMSVKRYVLPEWAEKKLRWFVRRDTEKDSSERFHEIRAKGLRYWHKSATAEQKSRLTLAATLGECFVWIRLRRPADASEIQEDALPLGILERLLEVKRVANSR